MPSVSKIPKNVNKYVTKCAFKIKNEALEHGKGVSFFNGKISGESKIFIGTEYGVSFDNVNNPNDIFIHNHPSGAVLSNSDLFAAVSTDVKKVFASTPSGFTAMDLTTVKKSISKKEMLDCIRNEKEELGKFAKTLLEPYIKQFITIEKIPKEIYDNLNNKFGIILNDKIKEFAKMTGATFSDVKWSDYKQLNK